MYNDKESPFRPGTPVPHNMFVGRRKEIQKITRYLNQCSHGRQEHVFLVGERGMGKSSLASYIMNYAQKQYKMLGIHIYLNGKATTELVVKEIIETLLNETKEEKWHDKISNKFQKHVKAIDFGVNVTFNPPEDDLELMTKEFPNMIKGIVDEIKNEKNGLFIVLDDINGLTHDSEFADWYKSVVDTIASNYSNNFPVFLMIVGYPEKLNNLFKHNESFVRIFHQAEIQPLKDKEVKTFFENAFNSIEFEVDEDAMNELVTYSSGMPTIMHEIGDATFWSSSYPKIDHKTAMSGIIEAGTEIGRKYLKQNVHSIRSEDYKNILLKLGEHMLCEFTIDNLKKVLTTEEMKKITDFLKRARKLGIIIPTEKRGTYKFVNNFYPVYFMIESIKL